MERDSLGLIETSGLVAAIEAADAGSKAANVTFRGYERARAGLITVVFLGDVAAVRAAVTAGSAAAKRVGTVISVHVIARPDRQLRVVANGAKAIEKLMVPRTAECMTPAPARNSEVETAPTGTPGLEEGMPSPGAACGIRGVQCAEPEAAQPVAESSDGPGVKAASNAEKAEAGTPSDYAGGNGHPPVEEEVEEEVAVADAVSTPHKKDKVRKSRSKRKA